MLGDIHEWYVENLKGGPAGATFGAKSASGLGTTSVSVAVPDIEAQASPFATLVFELHQQSGPKSTPICPRASLSQKMSGAYYSSSLKKNQLFSCNCASGEDSHRSAVEAYGREEPLPKASGPKLIVLGQYRRSASPPESPETRGPGSCTRWPIESRTSSQPWSSRGCRLKVCLHLAKLQGNRRLTAGSVMHDFEELLVHGLSVIQTRQMLRRSMSTLLAHASAKAEGPPRAKILDLVRYCQPLVSSRLFTE